MDSKKVSFNVMLFDKMISEKANVMQRTRRSLLCEIETAVQVSNEYFYKKSYISKDKTVLPKIAGYVAIGLKNSLNRFGFTENEIAELFNVSSNVSANANEEVEVKEVKKEGTEYMQTTKLNEVSKKALVEIYGKVTDYFNQGIFTEEENYFLLNFVEGREIAIPLNIFLDIESYILAMIEEIETYYDIDDEYFGLYIDKGREFSKWYLENFQNLVIE